MVEVRIGDQLIHLSWDEWEERVRDGRIPDDAAVRFPPVTGEDFRVASELEMFTSVRSDATRAWQSRFRGSAPPILTALLVGAQIRIWWFAQDAPTRDMLVANLTNWAAPCLENGEVWRPLTMGVLHYRFDHIFMNMVFMAYTSFNLERALGRANLALLFFGSVLTGSIASMFGDPGTSSLGASGGVFGLMGASVVFSFVHPNVLPERHRRLFGMAIAPYLLFMLWSGLQRSDIDNFSHVGGMLGGILLMMLLDPPPVERRPGWNRAVQLGTTGSAALVLGGLALMGPRVTPLGDSTQVDRAPLPATELNARDDYRAVTWRTPAAWKRGMTSAGQMGFASPAGPRAWSVRLDDNDTTVSSASLAAAWLAGVEEAFGTAEASPAAACELAGVPATCLTARVETSEGTRLLEWFGATRGVWSLQATWEVELTAATWLRPLRERLLASVVWSDPGELVAAEADAQARPTSVKARSRLAAALARSGEAERAAEIQRSLIEEAPEDPDRWGALFESERIAPGAVPDLDRWMARALSEASSVRIVIEVVEALSSLGREDEARGLLELAWAQNPGDRSLKRSRRRLGLPTALDTETLLPWELAHDPATLEARAPDAMEAYLARPLALDGARLAERERVAARVMLVDSLLRWLETDPQKCVDAVMFLRQGAPSDDEETLSRTLDELKRGADGQPPRWIPPELHEHVAGLAHCLTDTP